MVKTRVILPYKSLINKEAKILISDNSDAQVILCLQYNEKRDENKKTNLGNFIKGTANNHD
jgi:ribosomal protein L14